MNRKVSGIKIVFGFLGAVMIFLLAAPVFAIFFSTSFSDVYNAFGDIELLDSIKLTLWTGIIATFISVLFCVPLAYFLANVSFPLKKIVESFVFIPVVIPHTSAGIALFIVLSKNGFLGDLFSDMGLFFVDHPAGIVAAMMFVGSPFLINAARDAFSMIDRNLELAAYVDGANSLQAFWYISFPLALRGILSGMMLMWARGISEFGAVVILAYHPKILPVLIYERFNGYGLKAAQPAALIMILFVLVLVYLVQLVFSRLEKSLKYN